jgi:biofilm protein TabA
MILTHIDTIDQYKALNPLFPKAFESLKDLKCEDIKNVNGELIEGQKIFLNASRGLAVPKGIDEFCIMETHRKYIDIQYVMKGQNKMGWSPLHGVLNKSEGYKELNADLSGDCEFYNSVPQTWIETPPGSIVIFFPEDAHAPLNGEEEIVKVVLKVEV